MWKIDNIEQWLNLSYLFSVEFWIYATLRTKGKSWYGKFFLEADGSSVFFLAFSFKDGLVKANMEKLTFYALSAPEKLDRIGAYLSERLSRDVARHRYG